MSPNDAILALIADLYMQVKALQARIAELEKEDEPSPSTPASS